MLNVIEQATIERRFGRIQEQLEEVELFLAGNPVSVIRIKDASITDAQIDDLSITNAKFADLAITNAKITSIDAGDFTAGTLNAARIGAGIITADKLNISTLSAISADVGTITGGSITGVTITGGTVRTASSGERIEMTASPNAMRFYNSGGTEKYRFDPDGLKIYDIGTHWYKFSTGTFWASFFKASSTQTTFQVGGSIDFDFISGQSGGDMQLVAADDQINIWPSGNVRINGSVKTAIVPTKQGYRALYCLEAPEVWFFDFIKDKFDPIFSEVTEGEINALTTDQGELLVFRKRKGFLNTRFEKKTAVQFDKNNKFWGAV
jgi:hypothetical protein